MEFADRDVRARHGPRGTHTSVERLACDALESSRLTWCNALARRTGGSGWLEGAHLLWVGVAFVLVDEHERERFG